MSRITAEELRSLVRYEPETGFFYPLVLWHNKLWPNKPLGCLNKAGRRKLVISYQQYYASHLAWLYMTGEWPDFEIDHRNRIKSDDRWENLRLATHQQNNQNIGPQRNNTSGVPGVSRARGLWRAYIKVNYQQLQLGRFETFEDAVAARKAAELKHFGEFAP